MSVDSLPFSFKRLWDVVPPYWWAPVLLAIVWFLLPLVAKDAVFVDLPRSYSYIGMGLAVLAIVLGFAQTAFQGLETGNIRETRNGDTVTWRVSRATQFKGLPNLLFCLFASGLWLPMVLWIWSQNDGVRMVLSLGLGGFGLWTAFDALRTLFTAPLVVAIDPEGLTTFGPKGQRRLWSQVEAVVLDLKRSREIGLLLPRSGALSSELWIDLSRAAVTGSRFIERLRDVAPGVDVVARRPDLLPAPYEVIAGPDAGLGTPVRRG